MPDRTDDLLEQLDRDRLVEREHPRERWPIPSSRRVQNVEPGAPCRATTDSTASNGCNSVGVSGYATPRNASPSARSALSASAPSTTTTGKPSPLRLLQPPATATSSPRRRLITGLDLARPELRSVVRNTRAAYGDPARSDRQHGAVPKMRKVAIVASASGNGKTTLGIELARRLGVPFVELDALVHGPRWVETPDDELHARLKPIFAYDGWVIDGTYHRKLGDLVLRSADTVVWLDLPIHVWLPRLIRRSSRRLRTREVLWNGNRETLSSAIWGRQSLFAFALRSHFRRRREWPKELAELPVIRLTTPAEVDRFLAGASPSGR